MRSSKGCFLRTEEIFPDVIRVHFNTLRDMAVTFFRIQEFYDDAMFHDRIIPFEAFKDEWISRRGEGRFDYTENWSGFGLNSKTLKKWIKEIKTDDRTTFSPEEEQFVNTLEHHYKLLSKKQSKQYSYIFGVCEEEGPEERILVTHHELAHRLFQTNKRYKVKMRGALSGLPKDFIKRFEKILKKKFYARKVFTDEIQAHIVVSGLYGDTGRRKIGAKSNFTYGMFSINHIPDVKKHIHIYQKMQQIYYYFIVALFKKYPNEPLYQELFGEQKL